MLLVLRCGVYSIFDLRRREVRERVQVTSGGRSVKALSMDTFGASFATGGTDGHVKVSSLCGCWRVHTGLLQPPRQTMLTVLCWHGPGQVWSAEDLSLQAQFADIHPERRCVRLKTANTLVRVVMRDGLHHSFLASADLALRRHGCGVHRHALVYLRSRRSCDSDCEALVAV